MCIHVSLKLVIYLVSYICMCVAWKAVQIGAEANLKINLFNIL